MSSGFRNQLVGKSLKISIGEPWDFVSQDGPNKIEGVVLATSAKNSELEWILLEVSPFEYENKSISSVVAVNRYVSSHDIFVEMSKGNDVILNFVFSVEGQEFEKDNIIDNLRGKDALAILIGSIVSESLHKACEPKAEAH